MGLFAFNRARRAAIEAARADAEANAVEAEDTTQATEPVATEPDAVEADTTSGEPQLDDNPAPAKPKKSSKE